MKKDNNIHEDGDFVLVEFTHKNRTRKTDMDITSFTKDTSKKEIQDYINKRRDEILNENIGKKSKSIEEGDLYLKIVFAKTTHRISVYHEEE